MGIVENIKFIILLYFFGGIKNIQDIQSKIIRGFTLIYLNYEWVSFISYIY